MRPHFTRRFFAATIDVAAFALSWAAVCCLLILILSGRSPDNPWGVLAIAIIASYPLTLALFALWEAIVGPSAGRIFGSLELIDATGLPLGAGRRALRGLLKYGAIAGLTALSLHFDSRWGSEGVFLVPFVVYGAANAVVCLARRDGRSLLDLAVGSRSVLLAQ